jgi:hypothetical protein
MDPVEVHVSGPDLVVVDDATADDATALAFQQLLADRWATATAERTGGTPTGRAYGCAATWNWARISPRPRWSARPWTRPRPGADSRQGAAFAEQRHLRHVDVRADAVMAGRSSSPSGAVVGNIDFHHDVRLHLEPAVVPGRVRGPQEQ